MSGLDLAPDADLHRVARITTEIADKIRDDDPRRLFHELVGLCAQHPAKAAQVIMCYAAWFDPDATTETLCVRAESITRSRVVSVFRRSA